MTQQLPKISDERTPHDLEELAGNLINRVDALDREKAVWNRLWQDVADLVLPRRGKFYYGSITAGQDLQTRIYDSTAPWALEQLASGLHSYLTSPSQRWFKLALPPEMKAQFGEDEQINMWLELCSERMYETFNSNKSNFNTQAHELYLDLGAFGTAVMYIEEDYVQSPVRFCTYHLADCVIDEDAYGKVDTIGRKFQLEGRQALELWPQFQSASFVKQALEDPLTKHDFVHFVAPRADFDPASPLPKKFRWGSWYIYPQDKLILSESGYREFPFLVPRWTKLTGERYGRSPAMTALPDIRMVNAMAKTIIIAAQKIVDPPLMMPDEGFMLPIKTAPGSINYYNMTMGPEQLITPLETKGRPDIGQELIDGRREHIIRSFYVDWMNLQEGPRMTATEVTQRMEEKMRLMAPAISRQQSEFLDPLIDRTFRILQAKGLLPEVPLALQGVELKIQYVSPVARAQKMTQVMAFQQFMESIGVIAQVKPEVLDKLSPDGIMDFVSRAVDLPKEMLLTAQQVQQMRQQRAEQQNQQMQAMMMEQQSGAVANLADANLKTAQAGVL
jgi:hypothetical protein